MRCYMLRLFIGFLFLFCCVSHAKTIKVAVIDTGFDFDSTWPTADKNHTYDGYILRKPKLCPKGHLDLTGKGIMDTHGHGTHIAGIIGTYAQDADYCLVIIKYYHSSSSGMKQVERSVAALKHALEIGVDVVNYSAGGIAFNLDEYKIVKKLLDKGVLLSIAAGNKSQIIKKTIDFVTTEPQLSIRYVNHENLKFSHGIFEGYYPANYDKRIYSVMNIDKKGRLAPSSNRGPAFSHKAVGVKVLSLLPKNNYGIMTGTSQSTAKITSRLIKGLENKER